MTRKIFLTDVDEVLGDFQSSALKVIHRLTGKVMTPMDFDTWDIFSTFPDDTRSAIFAEICKPGFCSGIQPYPLAVQAIKELRKFSDVYAVTSPMNSPTWAYERTEWLIEHFGFNKDHIIQTATKFLVKGDFLLDDKPEHIIAWEKMHPQGKPMLWHIPNTRNLRELDYLRVSSWGHVVETVFKASKEA